MKTIDLRRACGALALPALLLALLLAPAVAGASQAAAGDPVPCVSICEPPPETENPDKERSMLVVSVAWDSGAPATSSPLVAGSLKKTTDHLKNVVNPWFNEASGGTFKPWQIAETSEFTIPAPRFALSSCTINERSIFTSDIFKGADAALRAIGIEPKSYATVVVQWNKPYCGFAGISSGNYVGLSGGSGLGSTPLQEIGHFLDIDHANRIECTANGVRVPLSSSCTVVEYGDRYDSMGWGQGSFNAVYSNHLGWLNGQFADLAAGDYSKTITLKPFTALPHGLRAIRLVDGPTTLWLEYRQKVGLDALQLDGPITVTPGLLIHREVPSILLGFKPASQLLDMTPVADTSTDSGLPVGQTWVNPLGSMKITLNSSSAAGATVTIASQKTVVPDVTGLNRTAASTSLKSVGLVLGAVYEEVDPNCDNIGTALKQSPSAGSFLWPGQTVSITLGKERKKGLCN